MRLSRTPAALAAVFILTAAIAGCATPPPASDPEALAEFNQTNDPLEPTNRVFYAVNDALDTVILRPVALAYHYAVPNVIRSHTHNVLVNLGNPIVLANDMLMGKPRRAGDTLMRLVVNSTIGLAGIFDVATDWGWPQHDSDFGITLAVWGMPSGPFLFLPVLGPSSPRDAVGFGVDIALNPVTWIHGPVGSGLSWGEVGLVAVDSRERVLDDLDKIKAQALDPYATIRSLSVQHRQLQVESAHDDNRATPSPWYPQPKPAP